MAFEPAPCSLTAEGIEQYAAQCRAHFKSRLKVDSDPTGADVRPFMDRVVGLLGGNIGIANAPSCFEEDGGSLVIEPGGRPFQIRLSTLTSPLRDVFTIAHELGHYVLHYPHRTPLPERIHFHRYGSDLVEAQANRFAAAFLMPAAEFTKLRTEYRDDEYRLAGHFGVSRPAVAARMQYVR